MTKVAFLSFALAFMNSGCKSQLVPLFKYPGVSYDVKSKIIKIPNLKITNTPAGEIYHEDSLIFIPENDFKISIYEFYGNYLIITPITDKNITNPIIYGLPKHQIKLYHMGTKLWSVADLEGTFLAGIDENQKKIFVRTTDNKKRKISFY